MSKIKIALISALIVLLSFGAFTILRFPYERLIDKKIKELGKKGVKIEYKSVRVIPWKLTAYFRNFRIKAGLFDLETEELRGRLLLKPLMSGELDFELRLKEGSISVMGLQKIKIPFNEGRGILKGKKPFRIKEIFLKGKGVLIKGEIEEGGRYNLRVRASGEIERKLKPFLRFLKKDREGFYILRSDIR